jgi:transcriptional regulator with XRE-family HTH domain
MTDYDDLVARNVKRLRGERNLSMAALAGQAGLSKQTLSKIEQGQGNPTLGTLEAISMALGTTARALITEWGSSIRVQSASSAQWIPGHDGETRMLEQLYGSGYVRTAVVRLSNSDAGPTSEPLSSGSIHQVFLISGHGEVGPQGRTVQLTEGDYVKFPADVPHSFKALNGPAVMHLVTSFPQVPQLSAFSTD